MIVGMDGKPLAGGEKEWHEAAKTLLMEITKFGSISAGRLPFQTQKGDKTINGFITVVAPTKEGALFTEQSSENLARLLMGFLEASAKAYGLLSQVPERPADGPVDGNEGSSEVRGQDGDKATNGA